jgi:predicted nucleotide-binding protein
VTTDGAVVAFDHEFQKWDDYNNTMLRTMFTNSDEAVKYQYSTSRAEIVGQESIRERYTREVAAIVDYCKALESLSERLELIPLAPGVDHVRPAPKGAAAGVAGGKVFVVHGHDEAVREAVARFISSLDLTPIILHEQASQGRTIVEKLEHHGDVGYAVVLLTPDDVGGSSSESLRSRARQNVILELGYFVGRLGRDHVCAMHRGNIEPSMMAAVGASPWRKSLKRPAFRST